MARSSKLINTLKKELRAQGITYKQIASALELSEASIKNMFAKGHFSLERIDRICELLNLEISDLARLAEQNAPTISQLSLSDEKELVSDMKFLIVAYCVMNSWSVEDIVGHYKINESECIQYLARLDRMKMIELQVNNRIRLLTSQNFEWHPNGPIERFFRQQVQSQFFNAEFKQDGELRLVMNGNISLQSRQRLVDRLKSIGDYFEELNEDDRHLDNLDRHGTTMIVAIRRWEFHAFSTLEKN